MASCRLQRILENDLGQPVLYFVNTKTRLGEAIEVVNPADEEHSDMWHTYLLHDELCIYTSVGLSF